jgi:hypothetical protein
MNYKEKLTNDNLKEFLKGIINLELTTSEIIEILNKNNFCSNLYYGEDSFFTAIPLNEIYHEICGLEKQCFELATRQGGREGEGDEFFEVIKIKPLDTYLKHDGSYYSYSGVEYLNDFYQVYPKQVVETHYYKGS